MTSQAKRVTQAAVRLPEQDRIRLVEEVLASLDVEGHSQAVIDRAWREEVERRSREIDEGRVKLVPWSKVKTLLKRQLRGRP